MSVPHNYIENPARQIEQAFVAVQQEQMAELPFFNHQLQVAAVDFSLFEGDWLGVLLTPWTLSLMLLPGPDRIWDPRETGARLALKLPAGNFTFLVGEQPQLGQYLSCSIQSPVTGIATQQEGLQLAKDIARLITAIDVMDIDKPDPARRALFGGLVRGA